MLSRLVTASWILTVCSVCAHGCRADQGAKHESGTLTLPLSSAEPAPEMAEGEVAFPCYPSLSPDGSLVVFAWAGDLWAVPIEGGIASRLTAHPADERRSAFSPDGRLLAFESDRDGARNLYIMPLVRAASGIVAGSVTRVTHLDKPQTLGSFTADGSGVLLSGYLEPSAYRYPRMYRVGVVRGPDGGVTGGGPITRLTDAHGQLARESADGSAVLFMRGTAGAERPAYRGEANQDVWRLRAGGGFDRITGDAANDGDAWPLPDGSVVFISSRDGQNNVWRTAPSGEARPLTRFAPTPEQITIGHGVRDLAVSASGSTAVFAVWDRLYRIDLTRPGASPEPIDVRAAADSPVSDHQRLDLSKEVSEAVLSPDGKTLAVVARGEVFVRSTEEGHPTRRVTETPGRERDLAWSPDGRVLYFASDDAGVVEPAAPEDEDGSRPAGTPGLYGIYGATVALSRQDIAPRNKAPTPPAVAEPKAEPTAPASPTEPAPTPAPVGPAEQDQAGAAPAGDAAPPEKTEAEGAKEKKPEKPDHGKRWAEALRFRIEPVAGIGEDARRPTPSPDGKRLLYTRGLGDLVLRELGSGEERTVLKGWDAPETIWAGDSRHIVYSVSDLDFNNDIWLMDLGEEPVRDAPREVTPGEEGPLDPMSRDASQDGGAERRWPNPVNLTRHPDGDVMPRLSADGKVLVFLSDRHGDTGEQDVWGVYLDRALEAMTGYERDAYVKAASEAAGKRKPLGAAPEKASGEVSKPMEFDAEDAYLRVRRITTLPGSEGNLAITPGGDRIVFTGEIEGGDSGLMSVDHKGGDRKVLQAGTGVSRVGLSLTGDKVSFVRAGQAGVVPKAGGKVETLGIDAPVVIETAQQQRQKFVEAARVVGSNFYHPTLKGLDWDALTARYLSLAVRTRTTEEFNRVATLLFGELNGSHLGISGGPEFAAPSPATGYLGVRAVPVEGGYRVEHVTAGSPADAKTARLKAGDVILSVDGQSLASGSEPPAEALEAALAGKAGKEVLVEIRRADGPEKERAAAPDGSEYLLMVPISGPAWDNLGYQQEVLGRQARVAELSGGRLGYLHIRGMSPSSVRDFERDLFAAAQGKEGLIIDVRDNGGGWTADILLTSLTAPVHAWTVPRGANPEAVPRDAYPRDRRLIYAWTRPLSVLINQHSFSNAEIFAHAIRTTGRGRLVGTPTFGGVISTGATTLIDGTHVRLPFRGWYLPSGEDMENNGARPDLLVPQTPADEAAGHDPQLEAAVGELLQRIGDDKVGAIR